MEHSRKMVLVPEERVDAVEHLSDLDRRMDDILRKKNLTDHEKAVLYLQILQQYTRVSSKEEEKSEIAPEQDSIPTLEYQPTDAIETRIHNAAPKRYKETAKAIFNYLKDNSSVLSWTPTGEIVYHGKLIPRTNIVTLINDLLRNKSAVPIGRHLFSEALKKSMLPKSLDVFHKLDKNAVPTKSNFVKSLDNNTLYTKKQSVKNRTLYARKTNQWDSYRQ